jgi:hypothetical protein
MIERLATSAAAIECLTGRGTETAHEFDGIRTAARTTRALVRERADIERRIRLDGARTRR